MNIYNLKSRVIISLLAIALFSGLNGQAIEKKSASTPNFIIIFADDMGYGDVGVFGHPTIKTPNLDKLAYEGQKWTNFYVAAPVCTPSRAGLLTGRLPIRTGMCSEKRRVLFPDSKGGLPTSEITIASALKHAGYKTACIGKWHLGHLPQYLPNKHGFDYYFGIPYSNDMDLTPKPTSAQGYFDACTKPKVDYFNVPLLRNSEIIERPAEQTTITKRYTSEAINFIKQNKKKPFLLYLAHSMPHVPLFRSKEFEGKSSRGIYGDVIEEIDWSVGEIIKALMENGLDKNTIVVFTSDNGPWLEFKEYGGSAGILSGGKGGTYEGGMREPTVFWNPELIKSGVISELGTTLDLLPTICHFANIDLPNNRTFDGYDISDVLTSKTKSPRHVVFYYRGTQVYAIRNGDFKAHFITQPEYGSNVKTTHDVPLLYNLNVDPSEKYNVANDYPEVIKEIRQILAEHIKTIIPVENQLEKN